MAKAAQYNFEKEASKDLSGNVWLQLTQCFREKYCKMTFAIIPNLYDQPNFAELQINI